MNPELNIVAIKRTNKIVLTAIAVLLVGLTVILGWFLEIDEILSIFSGAPTMKFNTALLFVLSSLGIICYVQKKRIPRTVTFLIATAIVLIGFSSLVQYGVNSDFGIDNFFVEDTVAERFPGRMSVTSALCFGMFGLSLLLFNSNNKKLETLGNYALAFISLIAVLALLTYGMQAVTTTQVLIFNSMAFHTSICFFLLSYSLSLSKPENNYVGLFSGVQVGSRLARRLIPFLIILPLLLGFVLLYVTDTNGVISQVGITIYTICFAFFGLIYSSWVAVNLNIEDEKRKQLERSLFETNKKLKENIRFKKQLVRTSPETILIINLNDQNIRYINKGIYPESGLNKKKILGMPIIEIASFIHPLDRQKILEFHRNILKSGNNDIHDIELRLNLKGDTWEWFNVRGKIFERRDENWVNEYVVLVRNITALKKTQKALLNAEKFSILGEVARTLAHELRNPITSIGMSTEIIDKKLDIENKEELQKYLNILNRSARTLNGLVTNLLNASNYSETVLKKNDLISIVEGALKKAADRIYLSGIEVIKNYSGCHFILADKEKLEIAILNMLVNASEATIPDEGIITIEVIAQDKEVLLIISDNGTGLDEDQANRLFDAFYTTKSTGVGVGLHSVKNILENHDATIEVDSRKNEGVSFSIHFPAYVNEAVS